MCGIVGILAPWSPSSELQVASPLPPEIMHRLLKDVPQQDGIPPVTQATQISPNRDSPDSTGINVFVQSLTVQNLRWVRQATVYKTLCLTHTLKSDWPTKLTYKNQVRSHTPINTWYTQNCQISSKVCAWLLLPLTLPPSGWVGFPQYAYH